MLLISCPYCGERPEIEFSYGGQAHLVRPPRPAELSDEGGHPVVQLHGLTSSRQRDRLLDMDLGRGLSGTRLLRW